MSKSIPQTHYANFRKLLKEYRLEEGLSQVDLARRLRKEQNYVSRYERGDRRLDVLELREICSALEIGVIDFMRRLEKSLK